MVDATPVPPDDASGDAQERRKHSETDYPLSAVESFGESPFAATERMQRYLI